MRKHMSFLVAILLISILCLKALFVPGLFTAHDMWHQVSRLYWYTESTYHGVFPPRWIAPMANGFGYPLFIFSYHFPWIVGLPFITAGVSIESTIKILFFISFLFSGWGMYWCSFLFTKSRVAAFVSAVIYLVAPWRFVTIFVSAAMGRAFIFILFPYMVGCLYLISRGKRSVVPTVLLAITVSAMVLSHLISVVTSLVLLLPFALYVKPSVKKISLSIIITILLTGWYVFPLLSLSHSIQASSGQFKTLYETQFVTFRQLLYSPWGYGIVEHTAKEGPFSYQIGFAQWIVVVLSTLLLIKQKNKKLVGSLLLCFALCVFLMLDYSKPIWGLAARFVTFDYPTMFLMPAVFISSFLASLCIVRLKQYRFIFGSFLIFVALINNRNYMRVNQYVNFSLKDIVTAEITTNSFHEYLPLAADSNVMVKNVTPEIDGEGIEEEVVTRSTTEFEASFRKSVDGDITLKIFGFPGLKVLIDDTIRYPYKTNNSGLLVVTVAKGSHKVNVFYDP